MRKLIFTTIAICISAAVFSQNALLNRSYWTEKTTLSQVKEAIEKGNDPVEMNFNGFDAVTMAILGNAPVEVVDFLLSIEGNDINKVTHDSRNYLMWAGMKGNPEMIEMIIKRGGDVHIIDSKGNNLQTFTAGGGVTDIKVYELYKKNGLKLTQSNRNGATILHHLAQNVKNIRELDPFVKKENLNLLEKDNNGNSLVHYAASQGNISLIKELMDRGLELNIQNKMGETALFFAARGKRGHQNNSEIFEELSKLGLDITAVNKNGENILHALANNKNKEVYDFLVNRKKVNVNQKDKDDNLPIMNAISRNNEVAFTAYYPVTKHQNQVNKKGYSLLTFAIQSQNEFFMKHLMANQGEKLDFTIIDKEGKNLITHLVANKTPKSQDFFTSYFELLKTKIQAQDETLHLAVLKEDVALITLLLEANVNIDAKNEEDLTALQLAAMKNSNTKVLKLLVNRGADKSIQTDFDETAYDLAKENELLKGDIEFLKQ